NKARLPWQGSPGHRRSIFGPETALCTTMARACSRPREARCAALPASAELEGMSAVRRASGIPFGPLLVRPALRYFQTMDYAFTPASRARIAAQTEVFSRLAPAPTAAAGERRTPAKKP